MEDARHFRFYELVGIGAVFFLRNCLQFNSRSGNNSNSSIYIYIHISLFIMEYVICKTVLECNFQHGFWFEVRNFERNTGLKYMAKFLADAGFIFSKSPGA